MPFSALRLFSSLRLFVRHHPKFCKRSIGLLLTALVAIGAVSAWFLYAAYAALPQLDGSLKLSGLHAPVSVVRDTHGVPTITAGNLDDLFFAQGYVTAQDRLWQMDMTRRFAAGELAEILGARYVERDRAQRLLGLRQVAERALAQTSPDERAQLEAYARGVNAFIAEHRLSLPLEMRLLGYTPRPWSAEDSVLVGLAMSELLNHGGYLDKLHKEQILARLGPDLTRDLYVETSERDIIPGHDLDDATPEPGGTPDESAFASSEEEEEPAGHAQAAAPQSAAQAALPTAPPASKAHRRAARPAAAAPRSRKAARAQTARPATRANHARPRPAIPRKHATTTPKRRHRAALDLPFELPNASLMDRTHPGSNEWVISGAHTASGRPLLSNDMHLPLSIPNTWYEAHLRCADFDVAGVTLPGAPWVIVGHNRRIAWGFTNLGPDVEDVYVEQFNAQGQYLTPQGYQQPSMRHEVIRVHHGHDVAMDVVVTRHGPILTSQIPGERRQVALRWSLLETNFTLPFFALDSAQDWTQFRAALARLNAPAQNVVYADVDGNIGYQATGLVPIRPAGDDGTLPLDGASGQHEWLGYIPFEQLPMSFNPPSGILATANGRVTPDDYPFTITRQWESPYRTERIYRFLRQDKKFTAQDMLALQNDVSSVLDKFIAQRMVYAIDQTPNASSRARQAAEILRHFNGQLTVDSNGAAIEQSARRWLMNTLLANKLGDDSELYTWFMRTVWLEKLVAFEPAEWLPPQYQSWQQLLAASVEAAVSSHEAPFLLTTWRYGDISRLEISHPLYARFPWLRHFASTGSLPESGNGLTVKQAGPFAPSERFTADLANLDDSTLNLVNGQSGHLFSHYFNDQFRAWYAGKTFRLPFDEASVAATATHRLTLEPR